MSLKSVLPEPADRGHRVLTVSSVTDTWTSVSVCSALVVLQRVDQTLVVLRQLLIDVLGDWVVVALLSFWGDDWRSSYGKNAGVPQWLDFTWTRNIPREEARLRIVSLKKYNKNLAVFKGTVRRSIKNTNIEPSYRAGNLWSLHFTHGAQILNKLRKCEKKERWISEGYTLSSQSCSAPSVAISSQG